MDFNRKAKDSVFTKVFGEPEYALKLYKVFHPEDTQATEDQVKIITLENVFTSGPYNDLGLLMNNHLMLFVEAQSTWSHNMPVRTFLYLAETYKRYFLDNEVDIHSSEHITIPTPEVYVIFTGERAQKPEYMRLSNHFDREKNLKIAQNSLELSVKMIYNSVKGDIVYQYINFCKVFDAQKRLYPNDKEKAVKEAMRICADEALLGEFIKKHESEVYNIMSDYIFNDELLMKIHVKNETRLAREAGAKDARIETVKNAVKMGLSAEETATLTGLTIKEVEEIKQSA